MIHDLPQVPFPNPNGGAFVFKWDQIAWLRDLMKFDKICVW